MVHAQPSYAHTPGDALQEDIALLKKLALLLLAAAVAALLCPATAVAQVPGPSKLGYVMPAGVDPIRFDFSFDGQFYDILGNVLLPNDPTHEGLGGAEFHVASVVEGLIDFSQLKITHNYLGGVEFQPSAPAGFDPWDATPGVVLPPGPAFLTAQALSARIGEGAPQGGHYFALMVVNEIDREDIELFRQSSFRVQAFVDRQDVPEPGGLAVALGALVAASSCMVRRRAKR
jgi:hypothetical protein